MDEFDIYPATQTSCPNCNSDDTEEDVTYPESQGLWTDGAGGYVDCQCNSCGHAWTRDFGEGDIPDYAPEID